MQTTGALDSGFPSAVSTWITQNGGLLRAGEASWVPSLVWENASSVKATNDTKATAIFKTPILDNWAIIDFITSMTEQSADCHGKCLSIPATSPCRVTCQPGRIQKTGVPVLVHLGAEALNLFKDLPSEGVLFP